MTPLRRYLAWRRLRIDWLAQRTGLKAKRLYNLSTNRARWTTAEAASVCAALAAEAGRDPLALHAELFAGIPLRPVASD